MIITKNENNYKYTIYQCSFYYYVDIDIWDDSNKCWKPVDGYKVSNKKDALKKLQKIYYEEYND